MTNWQMNERTVDVDSSEEMGMGMGMGGNGGWGERDRAVRVAGEWLATVAAAAANQSFIALCTPILVSCSS